MNKKIIHIVSRMNVGGPSKIINYYHAHMYEYQYDSIIICGRPAAEEGEIKPIESPTLQVIYLDGLSPGVSYWQSLKAFFKLLKLIKKIKPDIIHSHQAKAGLFGRLGGFLKGVPKTIHTYHGHVFYGYFSTIKTKIIIGVERFLARISFQSIAISPEILEDLVSKYKVCKSDKTTLINVGIDPHFCDALPAMTESKKNFGLPTGKIIIGFVGRLVDIKNPLAFIALTKELIKSNSNLHFVIAGDGNLKEAIIKKIKEEQLEKNITILPWIEKIETILVCLDLLVMTSRNEGTPLILMEAMLMGVPVASTAVGGIPHLIEHDKTGYLLSDEMIKNAQFLQNKLQNFTQEKNKIVHNAKEKIKQHHLLDNLLKQTIKLYNAGNRD